MHDEVGQLVGTSVSWCQEKTKHIAALELVSGHGTELIGTELARG